MKDLTNESKVELLSKVKSFLDITWSDTHTDNEVWGYIVSSIRRLDDIAGCELDYLADEDTDEDDVYLSMCFLGSDLLLNRCYYIREKALDDFEKNFQSELVSLFQIGRVYDTEETS